MLRHMVNAENLAGCNHVPKIRSRDRKHGRMGTGRNDNIIRADFRSAAILCLNRYSVAVLERSLAIYQVYKLVLQQELDTAAKL